jgi:hypothetical protein
MNRFLLRVAIALPVVTIATGAAAATFRTGPAAPVCTQAGAPHRVGLVVEHGDGGVVSRCVGFSASTITALAVLQASGIENATESYGALGSAVCQIDNEPARYTSCLPPSGSYWVLFIAHAGGSWSTSPQGASSVAVSNGDDVGFRYDPQGGADPPPASPAGTCPQPTPTSAGASSPPTPAVKSTPTPVESPGATPGPTPGSGQATGTPDVRSPAVTEAPSVTAATTGTVADPVNPGFLIGACGVGALLGLLVVQTVRRRRR